MPGANISKPVTYKKRSEDVVIFKEIIYTAEIKNGEQKSVLCKCIPYSLS